MKWTPTKDFWKSRGLPEPVVEFRFCDRLWRLDFAWPIRKIALEVEGGTWMKAGFGGHNRGSGMARDMAKYNNAARLGWYIYRVMPRQLERDMEIENYPKTYKGKRETVSEFLKSVLL